MCDAGEHEPGDGPVEVTVWSFVRGDGRAATALDAAVARFHAARPDIAVDVTPFDDPELLLQTYLAAEPGARPALVHLDDGTIGAAHLAEGLLPVGDCLDVDGALIPSIEATFTIDGVLEAAPWGVSTPLLYYDRAAFRAAGLPTDEAPASLDELRAAAETLAATGVRPHPLAIEATANAGGSWWVEQWLAQTGTPSLLPDNGRGGRPATTTGWAAAAPGLTFLRSLVEDGLATEVDGGFDDLLAVAQGEAAMAVHTSGSLGDVLAAIGGYPDVELGLAPLPGPGRAGGLAGGTAWWPVESDAVTQRAAWSLLRFLESPAEQAALSVATGYVPVRVASVDEPAFAAAAAEHPEHLVARGQLLGAPTAPAQLVPVAAARPELREVLASAVRTVVFEGADAATTLAAAAAQADALLSGDGGLGG